MRRALAVMALVVGGCAAQPPERTPLPDVEDVLAEPVGCQVMVGEPLGVDVVSVAETGAAAGVLEPGDVIISIDGRPTKTRPELSELMVGFEPGESIDITYVRDGAPGEASITLDESPADVSRGMIGVTVQTAFDSVALDEVDDVVAPSATARPIMIGGELHIFDPLTNSWQPLGIVPPPDSRWVSTSTGLYSVVETDDIRLIDLFTAMELSDDGFRGWDLQRLLGAVGDVLIAVVTAEIVDQPGFVNLAIAGFDPLSGATTFVTPVSNSFGIPVAAFGSPDGTVFVAVGADPESGDQLGVALFDAAGTLRTASGLDGFGQPMGWFDSTSMAFRDGDEKITRYDFAAMSAEETALPTPLRGTVTATVGDGTNILVVGGRDLLLHDLTDLNVSAPLAQGCSIGRAGDPGWGT